MLSEVEASIQERASSQQQQYVQQISRCQAADRIYQDWRLRYAPMRELLQQPDANPMLIKPIKDAFLSLSPLDIGTLPLKALLTWYEASGAITSAARPTAMLSWERRGNILHHLREVFGKLSCPSLIRFHAGTILLRYITTLNEDDVVKEIFAPIAAAVIIAYKALGQVSKNLYRPYSSLHILTCQHSSKASSIRRSSWQRARKHSIDQKSSLSLYFYENN
jgi:hypothetical protein